MNIEKAFEIIEKNIVESYISGPIKIDLIKKAETILGVTFPKSYYLFLQRYGELDIFGIEIYGIIKDPIVDAEKIPTMVCLTKEQRKDKNVLLPHELVIISPTGYGPYYVLDTSQMDENQECPVYMWDIGDKRKRVYDNFGDFLLDGFKPFVE